MDTQPRPDHVRVWSALALTALAALAASGCATVHSQNRCNDGVVVRCVTPVVCAYDRTRGCEVCRCDSPPYVPIER
jgi:hypothetical protein